MKPSKVPLLVLVVFAAVFLLSYLARGEGAVRRGAFIPASEAGPVLPAGEHSGAAESQGDVR